MFSFLVNHAVSEQCKPVPVFGFKTPNIGQNINEHWPSNGSHQLVYGSYVIMTNTASRYAIKSPSLVLLYSLHCSI